MVLENPWSDNVVALGSAAGFVDPLEATALFNLQAGIDNLIKAIQRLDIVRLLQVKMLGIFLF